MTPIEYPKIPGPLKRHADGPFKNRLIEGAWATPEMEYLQNAMWQWTEKIDGTNIRVHWDGHETRFYGRTDKSVFPKPLSEKLPELFPEELMEQTFGKDEALLFGEGYGPGIQHGGVYRSDQSFILFDVLIDRWWLRRKDVSGIGQGLGIGVVPPFGQWTLNAAIDLVQKGIYSRVYDDDIVSESIIDAAPLAEGIVGTPAVSLFDRNGDRVIVKLKTKDLHR